VTFPHYCPPRTFALDGAQMTIGRRSRSRGVEPEIDLSGPPLDPGVSTVHAVLVKGADGSWDLVDVGSRNGTVINDAPDLIAPNAPVHLAVGDRIKIGAWTVLTVRADQSR
jgi:pSer/pThr/pTyr-binding forkhead associated (FHA) protein